MDASPWRRRRAIVWPVLGGLALFLVALAVLRAEFRAVSWGEITRDVLSTPAPNLAAALALTALNYLVLSGYDLLAFRYVGKSLPPTHIVGASFLAYAIGHNVGLAMLSGASVRYRFYSRWGVTAHELSRIVVSCAVTFWLGLLALGGFSLASAPPVVPGLPGPRVVMGVGWALMAVVGAYLAATVMRREPIRVRGYSLSLPSPALATGQLLISAFGLALIALVVDEARQGEVQSHVGAALPGLSRRPASPAHPRRHLGAHRRRLPPDPAEVK